MAGAGVGNDDLDLLVAMNRRGDDRKHSFPCSEVEQGGAVQFEDDRLDISLRACFLNFLTGGFHFRVAAFLEKQIDKILTEHRPTYI